MADPLYQVLADARRIYRGHWPGAWCDAADGLAAFLMLATVAAWVPAKTQEALGLPPAPRLGAAAAVRCAGGALALAALTTGATLSVDAGLAGALRRSGRLIRGHGPELCCELAKAYLTLIATAIITVLIAGAPGLPYPLRMRLVPIPVGFLYGPFAALALVLIYFRLAAADRRAVAAAQQTMPAAGAG
jgi:hypothetical protein